MDLSPSFFSTIHPNGRCVEVAPYLRFGETLFDFGQKSYKINHYTCMPSSTYTGILDDDSSVTKGQKVFRFLLICTIVAPVLAILAKLVYRWANNFKVILISDLNDFKRIADNSQDYHLFSIYFPVILAELRANRHDIVSGEITEFDPKENLNHLFRILTPAAELRARAYVNSLMVSA